MKIIAVDDEYLALKSIERTIREALPDCEPTFFDAPTKAISFAEQNQVDVAFLDIEMGGMNGLTLAKKLKDIYGGTNIVFVTGYSEYAVDSYSLQASGYILKPVSVQMIKDAMEHLRNPVKPQSQRIFVHTFGNFEIFVDGKPIVFSRARSKEVLAYLIDRKGAGVSKKELAVVLWEDEEYTRSKQNQLQVFVSDLLKDLKEVSADNIIINHTNSLSVDVTKFECDYYGFNTGDANAVNHYTGEYMAQYSWGEFTIGALYDPQ